MTPQELKNSILQLAIQGKLVEQRPEEGTAEELYKEIQAEKQKLIKAGTIKKEKPLPEITDDKIPFDIPESWKWVRLGDIYKLLMGQSPDGESVSESTLGIEFHQGKVFFGEDYLQKSNKTTNKPTQIAEPYSVLLCVRAPVGIVNITEREICIGRGLCAVSTFAGMDARYVLYSLRSCKTDFIKKATGTTFVAITGEVVKNQVIPLPPLAEQKRIVAKIEELLPYVDRYEQAWSKLEDFNKRFPGDMQKSILQMAIQGKLVEQRPEEGTGEVLFEQIQAEKQRLIKAGAIKKEKPLPEITEDKIPFDIPDSWEWVSIGDICINIQYGTSRKSSQTGKMAVLRMGNIQNGKLKYDNLVYSTYENDIEKYSLKCGDLLFNRTNSKELVGKTAIYKGDMPAIFAGYLVRITPVFSDSDYLNYVMQSQFYWSYCQTVRSDAIGQSNINAEKLKHFFFPLPPLAEQKRIVAKLEEILPLCEQLT